MLSTMAGMSVSLPDIPEADCTPLVRQLLDLIRQQQQTIEQLRDEIARLKNLPPRPTITPSKLEATPKPTTPAPGKRPGSAKRSKTAQLTITDEQVVPLPDCPPDAVFKGYEDFVVQELLLQPKVTRYRRERWLFPDGTYHVANLPDEVLPGSHFGPDLTTFILHQYHHQHVTQPLLLEQLRQLGIDISAGQLNRILTEGKEAFHQEKAELLPVGLACSSYVQTDDTTARHQGQKGFCTHVGNELFAYFESTDSKSRLNFLQVLRGGHTDYAITDEAVAYWQRQKLPQALITTLAAGATSFADEQAWQAHLLKAGLGDERHVRIATEGALLGSLIAHGVSADLVVLSDGAGQFAILVHALCWIHAERPLGRLVPFHETHREHIEKTRQQIWELYQRLKAYRQAPDESERQGLEKAFDALVEQRTGYPSIDGILKEMASHRAELLRVLERPEVPLHNNLSESHIRDYVKKRKISGSTRSELGRRARDTFASLKKTCRQLGVNFWEYVGDRVRGLGRVPRLAALIRQKAEEQTAGKGSAALSTAGGSAAG
jgi:Transposase IS66 family